MDPHETTRTKPSPGIAAYVAAVAVSAGVGSATNFSPWPIAAAAGLTLAIALIVTRRRTPDATTVRTARLPRARPEPARAPRPSVEASVGLFDRSEPPPTIPPVFAMRILLAGPDPTATEGLLAVLRGALADVVVAHGQAAVLTAARHAETGPDGPLDAIVIAMHMASSLDTVARLRADGFASPILGLCGRAGAPSAARCQQAGCSGVAPEHITGEALMRELAVLLRRHLVR